MIHTNPMPADLPTNKRVSKASADNSHRLTAFLTMGVFAFAGAWIASQVFSPLGLVISLHSGAFMLCGMVAWAMRSATLAPELRSEQQRRTDPLVFPSFLAWTAILAMSAGFWLFVLR